MKINIQIIDDNVALTTLLAKTLAKFGYEPVVENNPLLAINTARHYLPDLILLDVMMPERDGGRVLADLRADLSLRYIPVVLLTGIAREAQSLADTGGIRSIILSKPFQLKELLQTIEEQLNESRSHSEQQAFNAEKQAAMEAESATASEVSLPNFDRMIAGDPENGSAFGNATPNVDFAFPNRDDASPDSQSLNR
ncbi:MAG: response regulator [Verrucomicrobiales bacterium]|nr:response regulator [Verrucomicrobiales bacterium]